MVWLLDTNIVSYAMRERDPEILRRVQLVGAANVRISALVAAEILTGAKRNAAREAQLTTDFAGFISHVAVEPWTFSCAGAYAEIDHHLRAIGKPIGVMDTLIAAHALSLDAVLVTNNVRHFERIRGIKLENWV